MKKKNGLLTGVVDSNIKKHGLENILKDVIVIGDWAFSRCKNISSLIVPESVTEIGQGAFFYCNNLTSAVISGSVKKIDGSAFSNCENLEKITIQEGVKIIDNNAFENCKNLKEIYLPKSIEYIGYQIFKGCENLEKVSLPSGLSSRSPWEIYFPDCKSLKEIEITTFDQIISKSRINKNLVAIKFRPVDKSKFEQQNQASSGEQLSIDEKQKGE